MNSVHDLRRTLEDHGALAPDDTGLMAAAQAGAVRLRRRRRVAVAGAVAALAAIGAVLPATVAHLRDTAPEGTAASGYRAPLQRTVDLVRNSGYHEMVFVIDGDRQYLVARPTDRSDRNQGGDIRVYDPGAFDPTALLRGEQVTVRGHVAYYVPDFVVGTSEWPRGSGQMKEHREPTVGWRDASGAWVIVYGHAIDKAELLQLAEAVDPGAPRDFTAPYHLSYVPDDLPGTFALSRENDPAPGGGGAQGPIMPWSVVAVAPDGRQPSTLPFAPPLAPDDVPMTITVQPWEDIMWGPKTARLGEPTVKIAGYEGWYLTGPNGSWGVPPEGSALLLNVGECAVEVSVADREQITFEELKRMIEGAQFKDCTDPSTWVAPLP